MQLNDFMNKIWDAQTINGSVVIDKRVTYGSEPDISFTTQESDGEINFVSAQEMYWEQMSEIAEMENAAENGINKIGVKLC